MGRGRAHKIVMPMPSYLTLIIPSPGSFQRQRRPKQRGHLPLSPNPEGAAFRSQVLRTCPHTGPFSLWDFMGFPGMGGTASPSLLPSSSKLTFPPAPYMHPGSPAPHSCCVHAAPSLAQPPADRQNPSGILSLWQRRNQHQGSHLFHVQEAAMRRKQGGQKGEVQKIGCGGPESGGRNISIISTAFNHTVSSWSPPG